MRIYIIGNSCSGKTTLARELSRELGIRHHSTDDIYWVHKFDTPRAVERRAPMLHKIVVQNNWIIEGASTSWTHEAVANADIVIELKAHRGKLISRALRRYIARRTSKNENETLLNIMRLCKYIWNNENPAKRHHQQYVALLSHAKGERVVIKNDAQKSALIHRLRNVQKQ